MAVWRPDIVCDIGANSGESTTGAKWGCPEAYVQVFEVDPRIHAAGANAMVRAGVDWRTQEVTDQPGSV